MTLDITGDTMFISWNPCVGLSTIDECDRIDATIYSGLGHLLVQLVGTPSSARTLSSWLSMSSIGCARR